MKKVVWIGLSVATLAGLGYFTYDILSERTVMPATEYDEQEKSRQSLMGDSSNSASNANDTTQASYPPGSAIPDQRSATNNSNASNTIIPNVVSSNTNSKTSGEVTPPVVVAGRKLSPSDFHINHKLNARLRFTNFLNTFKEGDYVTGSDLAIIYGNDKEINSVVRKIVVKYFNEHIDYIQRKQGELIINTVDQQPAITKIYVPLLIDMNLTINHGSKIILGKTFISKEKKFNNINMLPLNLKDIEIKQSSAGAMPSQGYVSGDNYYVNYPSSLDCYKLK